jgi:hypothetical protein
MLLYKLQSYLCIYGAQPEKFIYQNQRKLEVVEQKYYSLVDIQRYLDCIFEG